MKSVDGIYFHHILPETQIYFLYNSLSCHIANVTAQSQDDKPTFEYRVELHKPPGPGPSKVSISMFQVLFERYL